MWTSLFTKDLKWDLRMLKCWSLLWVLNSSFLLHHQKLPTCLDVGHDQVQVQEGVGGGAAAQRAEAEQTTAWGQGATTGRPDVHHHQPPPHADGAVHRPWPHPCPWRWQDSANQLCSHVFIQLCYFRVVLLSSWFEGQHWTVCKHRDSWGRTRWGQDIPEYNPGLSPIHPQWKGRHVSNVCRCYTIFGQRGWSNKLYVVKFRQGSGKDRQGMALKAKGLKA